MNFSPSWNSDFILLLITFSINLSWEVVVLDNTVEYQSRPDTKSHCIALKDSR